MEIQIQYQKIEKININKTVINYRYRMPNPSNNIKFSYSFLDKFSIQTKLSNSNDVVLRSRDSGELILMKEIQVNSEEYHETLATLDYQKKLSHEQLLALVDYYPQPSLSKFVVLYQHCWISLLDQFQDRMAEGRSFAQAQLWSIFTSLAFGLAYLQQQNVGHGSISLADCYINQQGFIKISDPTCATSNPYSIQPGYFYSPEILRCLAQQTGQQINIFKSDAFSLGCCILQLSLMRDITDIFDHENGQIDRSTLRLLLDDFSQIGYSKQYVRFLNELLEFDDQKRLDFVALKKDIFGLMLIDGEQTEEKMRQSYGIKSSISSLCRSKGEPNNKFNPQNHQLKTQKSEQSIIDIANMRKIGKEPAEQRETQLKKQEQREPLQLRIFWQKPNVDHLFGNMKKSINLDKQRPTSNNMNFMNSTIEKQNKQNKQSATVEMCRQKGQRCGRVNQNGNGSSKRKVLEDIAHIQENIEKLEFNIEKKRRVRESETQWKRQLFNSSTESFGSSSIASKAKIIKKQLDLLFRETQEKSPNTANTANTYTANTMNTAITANTVNTYTANTVNPANIVYPVSTGYPSSNLPIYSSQITANSQRATQYRQPAKQITHTSHMLFSFHPQHYPQPSPIQIKPKISLPLNASPENYQQPQQMLHIQSQFPLMQQQSQHPLHVHYQPPHQSYFQVLPHQHQQYEVHGKQEYSSIKRSMVQMGQNVYTEPSFLRMMQADMQQILNRRKFGGLA